MKIAIVEDELLAVNYLKQLIAQQNVLNVEEVIVLRSKKEAIGFFSFHTVDLIFMDMHLGDGKSLEIFEEVEIKTPIIFVTTYDEYAIRVFKHFTIDYILKPYDVEEFLEAIEKFVSIQSSFSMSSTLNSVVTLENSSKTEQISKIVVTNGQKIIVLKEGDIAYFFASGKHLFVTTTLNKTYIYDDTLKDIIDKLNPNVFYKINRKYIVNRHSIKEIIKHSSQKVEIVVLPLPEIKAEILVSKPQISEFKEWLEKE